MIFNKKFNFLEGFNFYESKSKNYIFFIAIVIVTLLGADKISIPFSGVTVKLVFFFLGMFGMFFFLKNKLNFCFSEWLFFSLMILGGVGALFNSENFNVAIFYNILIIFTFIFVYGSFKSLSRLYGFEFIKNIYIYSFRFQIILCLVLFPFMHTYDLRFSLFYYEPSYLSIAAIPYLGFVFFSCLKNGLKEKIVDLFFIFVLLFVTKSAVLVLILMLLSLLLFVLYRGVSFKSKIKIFSLFLLLGGIFLFSLYVFFPKNLFAETLRNFFYEPDKVKVFLSRMGNRAPRIQLAWAVLIEIFPNGVGGGNYKYISKEYISLINFQSLLDYNDYLISPQGYTIETLARFLDPTGSPAVNIFLEALVELGALGGIGFIGLCSYIIFILIRNFSQESSVVLFIIILVFFMILSIESSYMKLPLWAFMGCVSGIINNEKNHI